VKALLVVNPRAGRLRGPASAAQIKRQLDGAGLEVSQVEAAALSDVAPALAQALQHTSPEETRVIVAGGDGTINAVLPALIGTTFPLAILPVGSVNVLARELGIPLSLDDALPVAAAGRLHRIDLGTANGRPFGLMAGIGFDAAVVNSVTSDLKNLAGSFAYIARGIGLLARYPLSRFRVTVPQGALEADAWLAVAANARHYTYSWRLVPNAEIDDGYLDLCLFSTQSAAQTTGQIIAALVGRHTSYPGVLHLRAQQLRLQCDPPVAVQLDGDPAGQTPVDLRVAAKALTVVTL